MGRKNRMDIYRLVPSTTVEHEVSVFTQRVNAAMRTATNLGPCLLFAHRNERGMHDYIAVRSSPQSQSAAATFAEAVSSEAEFVDPLKSNDDLAVVEDLTQTVYDSEIARAHIDNDSVGSGRYSQANSSPLELSRIMPEQLEVGQWFAISVRQPTTSRRGEVNNWSAWFAAKTEGAVATHPSLETNSVVIEIFSGNVGHGRHSKSEARRTLTEVVAAMPGFDALVNTKTLSRSSHWIPMLGLSLALFVAGFIVPGLLPTVDEVPQMPQIVKAILLFSGGLVFIDAGLRLAKLHRPDHLRIRDRLMNMRPPTSKKILPPKPPQREQIHPQTGKVMKKRYVGDYPLTRRSIKTAPSVFAAAFSPSAGVVSGETRTAKRDVDHRFTEQIGPFVAEVDGLPIHISATAASFGTSFLGAAGSGKSQTLRSFFGFSCLERMAPSGRPGFPGRNNTLIAIENKGPNGAAHYINWAKALGDTITVSDLADDSTAAIDLFGNGETISEQAQYFVSLMKSGFEEGDIGARSGPVLERTIAAGLAVDEYIIDQANENIGDVGTEFPADGTFLTYAHILLGGWTGGDDDAIRLYGAIRSAAKEYEDGDSDIDEIDGERYVEASEKLAYIFHNRTPANRASLIESSENKVVQLRKVEGFFSDDREGIDLYEAIDNHESLVINLGPSISGVQVVESTTKIMSAMITHAIKDAVAATCSDWMKANRWVSLFGDELALLAGSSPETVTWFREQGREFGVRSFFATQRPRQLDEEVRESFLGADTLFAYRQSAAAVVDEVVREIELDGETWTAQDVTKLPEFTAIIRTVIDGTRQNSFVASMTEFESRRDKFAELQGYDLSAVTAEARTEAEAGDAPVAQMVGADFHYEASDDDASDVLGGWEDED